MRPLETSRSISPPSLRSPPFALPRAGRRLPAEGGERDLESTLRRLEWLSRLLDEAITIPGTSIRVGWDSLLGLLPVVGDGATTLVSAYYLWQANRLGARKRALLKMAGNVAVDFAVGTIPLVGDLIDVTWRANRRNLNVLVEELERQGRIPADSPLLERLRRRRSAPARSPYRSFTTRPFIMP